jgi:hypothetical protein
MKLHKIISIALGLALMPIVGSCSDDDEVAQTPLASPTGGTYTATYSSIDFSWDRVDGATTYGYEFSDADGKLITRSLTQTPQLTFSDLKYNTVYYLTVWAYGAYKSADGTSEQVTYELRTNDLKKLATPVLSLKRNSATRTQFSWEAVEDAESYTYTLYKPDGSVQASNTTSRLNYTATTNQSGTYTFTLTANTSVDGYYSESGKATITVDIE